MRRVLIDECINPRLAPRLRAFLPDDVVETVRDLGWVGQPDHILVPQIQGRFDVFVTMVKGFEYEHNVEKLTFAIVVLDTSNNQMSSYERLLEDLIRQIQSVAAGQVVHVKDPER